MAFLGELVQFDRSNLAPTTTVEKTLPVVPESSHDSNPTAAPTRAEVVEYHDTDAELEAKADALVALLTSSSRAVFYTGAGVSTAASIPDYRGPNGIWTLLAQGLAPTVKISLDMATPTYTHMALVELVQRGIVKFIVSTNVDGLHRRSGIPATSLAELHGNVYLEVCNKCGDEHLRLFDVRGAHKRQFVQLKRLTGRLCESIKADGQPCRGLLRDSIINFGEQLPPATLEKATEESKIADLTVVLGSSMRVSPACELPSLSYDNGGKFCIVNLQKTSYDADCLSSGGVRVFSDIDEFMKKLMHRLGIIVPAFSTAVDEEMVKREYTRLIPDPDAEYVMRKYNVSTMADDGPPPAVVLDQIKTGFTFRRHVVTKEKHAKLALEGNNSVSNTSTTSSTTTTTISTPSEPSSTSTGH
ncbi:NAD-dependent protein deacetylase sirtuin-6 [Pelomyxa schiedti]|nr:NAD-dependent protein deacetylase sirtuin-6 [Pelomyxa schiedti]